MGFTDGWLQELVRNELVAQLAAARHVTITQTDLASARNDLTASLGATLAQVAQSSTSAAGTAAQSSARCPRPSSTSTVRTQATFEALYGPRRRATRSPAEAWPPTSTPTGPSFDTLCLRGLGASTQAQAQALRAKLVFGAPFDQVAAAAGQPADRDLHPTGLRQLSPRRHSVLGTAAVGGFSQVFSGPERVRRGPAGLAQGEHRSARPARPCTTPCWVRASSAWARPWPATRRALAGLGRPPLRALAARPRRAIEPPPSRPDRVAAGAGGQPAPGPGHAPVAPAQPPGAG